MVGTFPDGNSALMLVCAWLRHVAGTQWGSKKYMNMKHLESRRRFTGRLNTDLPSLFLNLRKTIDGTCMRGLCPHMRYPRHSRGIFIAFCIGDVI